MKMDKEIWNGADVGSLLEKLKAIESSDSSSSSCSNGESSSVLAATVKTEMSTALALNATNAAAAATAGAAALKKEKMVTFEDDLKPGILSIPPDTSLNPDDVFMWLQV